ncbi:hypothetical protein ASF49_14385 [Methylobacterium sp. Leaf104]|nr:hypothetical protein ASF49_14385 [Methylobacterium sp. Leaf104]
MIAMFPDCADPAAPDRPAAAMVSDRLPVVRDAAGRPSVAGAVLTSADSIAAWFEGRRGEVAAVGSIWPI